MFFCCSLTLQTRGAKIVQDTHEPIVTLGKIEFQNVSANYFLQNSYVLKNVNVTILPG